jgi:hypothetical protein
MESRDNSEDRETGIAGVGDSEEFKKYDRGGNPPSDAQTNNPPVKESSSTSSQQSQQSQQGSKSESEE